MAQIKTAADFNREEAAKQAAKAQPVDESNKKPKLNKEGKFICSNKGCKVRNFTEEEKDNECNHHVGDPVFHDLKKYWSCCNPNGESGKDKIAYDWDEFQALPTCTVGTHTKKMV